MRTRSKLVEVCTVALCFLLSACGGGVQRSDTESSDRPEQIAGKPGGSITHRVTTPIKTLNYYQAADEPSVLVTLFLINDRLVALDHEKQTYVPSLAESYTVAPDGVTVDVQLREGLKFSDGHAITSNDVKFSLEAAYEKTTNSPIFRDALMIGEKEIKAEVIDDRRLKFTLPEKVAAVENYLENLAVLPKHSLEADLKAGKLAESWKIDSDPKSVVGSGPFMIDTVQPGERVTLKRNPNYWKKDPSGTPLPYLDSLVLEIASDPNNTLARLQQNAIDIADRIRTSDFASLKTGEGQVRAVDAGPGLASDHIWFNLNPAKKSGESLETSPKHRWFADKGFRKAIAFAVDRQSISTNTLQGLATPVYGFVPAGNRAWLDTNIPKTEYDLERSRSLLSEAGFSVRDNAGKAELFDKDENRVEFTLLVPAENEPRKLMAAVIQEDLAKLGIAMQVVPLDFQGINERWNSTFDYDAVLSGVSLTAIDPSSFVGFLPSKASSHQWRPKQTTPATEWEKRIDELFEQQASETDPAIRKQLFNEIQSIIVEEMPVIPIVSRHIVSAVNGRIGNLSPSGILPYSLWNADRLFVKN